MNGVAEFQKVSFSQFLQDSKKTGFIDEETSPEIVKVIWENIKLPARATSGSAGYDFYLPYPFSLYANGAVTIPTGIRVEIRPEWALVLAPRSSLGFKYGMRLVSTLGIIDRDFAYSETEGHIMVRITVDTNMCLQEGTRFVQGIFFPHGLVEHDEILSGKRTGGIGSTGVF